MRLYMLSAGYIACEKEAFVTGGGKERIHAPTPFFLIQHQGKNILFDTGNPTSCIGKNVNEAAGEAGIVLTEAEYAPNALRALGVAPEEIDIIIMSHLHIDHIGALKEFPKATVAVRKTEFEYANRPDTFMQHLYTLMPSMSEVDWYLIDGSEPFDVCGDGRLVTILTPGHTPGHQSLLVKTDQNGVMMLAADACYSRENITQLAPPPGLVCDRVKYLEQLRLMRLYEKAGMTVVTGHDADGWKQFRHAPEYYE